jgi:hypothetical protein
MGRWLRIHCITGKTVGRWDDSTRDRWVSVGTCAPNPLRKLINIYSDDESPESSHDTPVHVQEEKGSEKTSSPEPEVQTKEVPQKETEVESGLETKGPNTSETEADLKDKPEPEEPKKESPQKEINGSAANEQVSNEYVPECLYSSQYSNPR